MIKPYITQNDALERNHPLFKNPLKEFCWNYIFQTKVFKSTELHKEVLRKSKDPL